MNLEMFSVQDVKAGVFNPPQCFNNVETMKRAFTREFNKENSMVNQFPHDFRVFKVGTYNDGTGEVTKLPTPKLVLEIKDIVGKQE